MSLGSVIGGVAGGVVGFFAGGLTGAYYGATIGFGIGMVIDPITPDIPTQGLPDAEQAVMNADIGGPIIDVCGTSKVTGQLLAYGLERNVITYSESQGGKGGGGDSQKQETGREYFMTWAVGLVACPDNPVNALYAIYKNDDIEPVWSGELLNPVSGGEETIIIDGIGSVTFYFGTDDQIANTAMGNIINDSTLNSPSRYLCWAIFDDCYIGKTNRTPTYRFVLQKNPIIPELTGDGVIQKYTSNPAHTIWYILHTLSGLPVSWLNVEAFQDLSDTLYSEDRGICVQFNAQQSAMSFVENINGHIDNILIYNTDGQFHPKLIRDDYTFANLPVVTESDMLDDPTIQSASFIDTINESKVQYTELYNVNFAAPEPITAGEWIAPMSKDDSNYVFIYDVDLFAVFKIDMSPTNPEVVEMLVINDADYFLDHISGVGMRRGGYSISKSNDKLWYCFRNTINGDVRVVTVDISGSTMSIDKTTDITNGLLSGQKINDMASNSQYAFICTSRSLGRIIRFDTNHDYLDEEFTYEANSTGIDTIEVNNLLSEVQCGHAHGAGPLYVTWKTYNFALVEQVSYNWGGLWTSFVRYDEARQLRWMSVSYPPTKGDTSLFDSWDSKASYRSQRFNYSRAYLGMSNTYVFIAWLDSSGSTNHFGRMTIPGPLDFDNTALTDTIAIDINSAKATYNENTDTLGVFTYSGGINSVATYDSDLNHISDTELDEIIGGVDPTGAIDFKKSISDPPAVDPGNIAIQERTVSKTTQFGLFVTNDNAVWAANNLLQKGSYPLLPISFTANRNLFRFQPGDVFRCNYAPYEMVDMVTRVLSIEQEDMNSENIIVSGIQDFFSITRYAANLGTPIDNAIGPPDYDCDPFVDQAIFENPWILSNSVQIIPVASRLTNLIIGFSVYMSLDGGASYNILTSSTNIQPYGELSQDYGLTYAIDRDEGIYIDFKNDADSIENQTFDSILSGSKNMAILGGTEIISFQNITPISSTIYHLENVIRGRWGTVRQEHSISDGFWFIQKNIELLNDNQIITGASRRFKLVPYNSQKQGSLAAATPIDITIEGESQKPYEPNNFDANGESFNPLYASGTDIETDWTPRVRGQGAGSMISGIPVITNTDHEGLFRIEVWVSAAKVRDISGIDAIVWDYTNAMNVSDNGTPAQEITFILFNYIILDGITYESDGVQVICNKE